MKAILILIIIAVVSCFANTDREKAIAIMQKKKYTKQLQQIYKTEFNPLQLNLELRKMKRERKRMGRVKSKDGKRLATVQDVEDVVSNERWRTRIDEIIDKLEKKIEEDRQKFNEKKVKRLKETLIKLNKARAKLGQKEVHLKPKILKTN